MDRFIKMEKNDFIGREAAAQGNWQAGPKLRRVSMIVDAADADVMGDEPIWAKVNGKDYGTVEKPHGYGAPRFDAAGKEVRGSTAATGASAVRGITDGEWRVVGWVTSGGYAHYVGKSMAQGYVPAALAENESEGPVRDRDSWPPPPRPHQCRAAVRSERREDAGLAVASSMTVTHASLPPSVLPDISPTGGRLDGSRRRMLFNVDWRSSGDSRSPPCGGDVRQDRGGRDERQPCRNDWHADATFGRHRKIMPFEPDGRVKTSCAAPRGKRRPSLNQHVLGYGETAEARMGGGRHRRARPAAMRRYRLERIRAELKRRDYAGALLYDPVNIRYATDSTNMQLWVAHNPTRHCFVATEGPVVLFDYFSCEHLSDHSGMVDEVRPAVSWIYLYGGELTGRRVERWAAGIADLVREHGGGNRRIAVDHLDPEGVAELGTPRHLRRQWRGGDGERAPDQIARRDPLHAPRDRRLRGGDGRDGSGAEARHLRERAVGRTASRQHRARRRMDRDAAALVRPAHQSVVPGMLLARHRGRRPRRLRHRPDRPLRLLRRPVAHLAVRRRQADQRAARPLPHRRRPDRPQHRTDAARASRSASSSNGRKNPPPDCFPARYGVLYHGVGLADEYPTLPHAADWTDDTPDGVLEPGMVLCVESYIGRLGGHEGVKIEEQMLITDSRQRKAVALSARRAALMAG